MLYFAWPAEATVPIVNACNVTVGLLPSIYPLRTIVQLVKNGARTVVSVSSNDLARVTKITWWLLICGRGLWRLGHCLSILMAIIAVYARLIKWRNCASIRKMHNARIISWWGKMRPSRRIGVIGGIMRWLVGVQLTMRLSSDKSSILVYDYGLRIDWITGFSIYT